MGCLIICSKPFRSVRLLKVLPSGESIDSSSQKRCDLAFKSPVRMMEKGFSFAILSNRICSLSIKAENTWGD